MSRFARAITRGVIAVIVLSAYSGAVRAFEFNLGPVPVRIDNLITVGAMMRMQERDSRLIGKTNMTPGLCLVRDGANYGGDDPGPTQAAGSNSYSQGQIAEACSYAANEPGGPLDQYKASIGGYTPNGDNGNLNFDKYDIVHGTAKLTTDVNIDLFDFHFFGRGLLFYDAQYQRQVDHHPDPTVSPTDTDFTRAGKEEIAFDYRMLDYFVSRNFQVLDRQISFRLGNQVLNWGESAFLIPNSLNSINPPNQALLRIPGFDIKELLQPVGMAYVSAELMPSVNLEGFYQYEYKPVTVDPVGSFFSSSDTLGAGGSYAMLSFGRAAEDPGFVTDDPRYPGRRGYYRPIDTCDPANLSPPDQVTPCIDSAGVLGSTASRTIFRDKAEEERRKPQEGGQYGFALKYFAEWLNGGSDLGLYFANYHSRFPTVSAIAAQDTCITDFNSLISPAGCGIVPATGQAAAREPLPVDTVRLIVEYPEDVHMYGFSFNTTVGDFALSGEYTFRDNLPMQVHTTDLIYAALQPAFPAEDVAVPPVVAALTIPGRRSAVPDFLMTNYRKEAVTAGQYIRGYERMKQGQTDITLLKIFGGDNWLGASQITALLEFGHTYVFDFPDLDELQFQGGGVDTHISAGADGSAGINPLDVRTDPDDPSTNRAASASRQNPTAHQDIGGFGTQHSWGYRAVGLTRYDDAAYGFNIEILTGFFHDVHGVGPGIGQNFVAGRKAILLGFRWDFLSTYNGEIRYTWFTGGGHRDALRDRDNLLVTVGYQF